MDKRDGIRGQVGNRCVEYSGYITTVMSYER